MKTAKPSRTFKGAILSGALGLAVLVASAAPALAAFDDTTLRVASRVLGFLDKPLTGTVTVGIVYAPEDSRSVAEANNVLEMLGKGKLSGGNLTLQGRLVKIADVDSANVGLFLLSEGVGASASHLAEVTRKKHIPCITTDLAQARNGACAISVRSQPKVEISVNQAAAAASSVNFSLAFRMLIVEF